MPKTSQKRQVEQAIRCRRPFVVVLIVLATSSASLYTVTAYLGGQIHHTEIASATRAGSGAPQENDNE